MRTSEHLVRHGRPMLGLAYVGLAELTAPKSQPFRLAPPTAMLDTSVRRIWASCPGDRDQAETIEDAEPLLTQATMLSPPECQMPPVLAMVMECDTRLPLRDTDSSGARGTRGSSRIPWLVGKDPTIPKSVVGSVHNMFESLFARAQGFLDPSVLRDIARDDQKMSRGITGPNHRCDLHIPPFGLTGRGGAVSDKLPDFTGVGRGERGRGGLTIVTFPEQQPRVYSSTS